MVKDADTAPPLNSKPACSLAHQPPMVAPAQGFWPKTPWRIDVLVVTAAQAPMDSVHKLSLCAENKTEKYK